MNAIAATVASNASWAFHTILKFVMAQLERVNRKEIVISTLRGISIPSNPNLRSFVKQSDNSAKISTEIAKNSMTSETVIGIEVLVFDTPYRWDKR